MERWRRRDQGIPLRVSLSPDHPAVARVFAGGNTEEAFPYLILEYVPGKPEKNLTCRTRCGDFPETKPNCRTRCGDFPEKKPTCRTRCGDFPEKKPSRRTRCGDLPEKTEPPITGGGAEQRFTPEENGL